MPGHDPPPRRRDAHALASLHSGGAQPDGPVSRPAGVPQSGHRKASWSGGRTYLRTRGPDLGRFPDAVAGCCACATPCGIDCDT
jgi:hypothetical protein